jgi:predicted double-glycine peptidase
LHAAIHPRFRGSKHDKVNVVRFGRTSCHGFDFGSGQGAQARGFKGAAYKGLSMEDLLTLQSPIVPIDFHGNPHFVVVRGLNTAGEIHLADPAFGNHAMSKEAFQAIWREGIGFVVTQ